MDRNLHIVRKNRKNMSVIQKAAVASMTLLLLSNIASAKLTPVARDSSNIPLKLNRASAEAHCKDLGGRLPTITELAKNLFGYLMMSPPIFVDGVENPPSLVIYRGYYRDPYFYRLIKPSDSSPFYIHMEYQAWTSELIALWSSSNVSLDEVIQGPLGTYSTYGGYTTHGTFLLSYASHHYRDGSEDMAITPHIHYTADPTTANVRCWID